jgi:aryl-alcohol dehydrogenase-like predicted oxidoreductase
MDYVPLGSSDLRISRIGFGCWAIGGHGYGVVDEKDTINAVQVALSAGINFFDTANVYGFGHSEEVLSKALGSQRHDLVIATKCGVCWTTDGRTYRDCSAKGVASALEASLRRLKLDCIPLYQVHCHDGVTPVDETMEALRRCRDAGKVKMIGCTNFAVSQIESMNRVEKLSSVQLLYGLTETTNAEALHQHFVSSDMTTIVYGALGRGLLSGKYDGETTFGENDTRSDDPDFKGMRLERNLAIVDKLKSVAVRYNKSITQTALRWVLDSPFVSSAIVGMKTSDQVGDNVGAIGWTLNKADWRTLERTAHQERTIYHD